jgi:hypothetical protein
MPGWAAIHRDPAMDGRSRANSRDSRPFKGEPRDGRPFSGEPSGFDHSMVNTGTGCSNGELESGSHCCKGVRPTRGA